MSAPISTLSTTPSTPLKSTPERIVIATDGGAAGRAALRWAIVHAGDRAVQLELVCAEEDDTAHRAERARTLRAAEQVLSLILPRAEVTVALHAGDPLELLARASRFNELLVIGTHHGEHGRPHGRGLPQRLAAVSACPIVVVPSDWICRRGPIVIGVTTEEIPSGVLGFGEREAENSGEALRLVHAWDMPGIGAEDPRQDSGIESIPERQRLALGRLEAQARRADPELSIRSELHQGPVVASLLMMAADASLLVLGRPRRSAASRALFGSVSSGVLTKPPCPVAVIP
jgi:nucleotide-binding universal stress UspA family protein